MRRSFLCSALAGSFVAHPLCAAVLSVCVRMCSLGQCVGSHERCGMVPCSALLGPPSALTSASGLWASLLLRGLLLVEVLCGPYSAATAACWIMSASSCVVPPQAASFLALCLAPRSCWARSGASWAISWARKRPRRGSPSPRIPPRRRCPLSVAYCVAAPSALVHIVERLPSVPAVRLKLTTACY